MSRSDVQTLSGNKMKKTKQDTIQKKSHVQENCDFADNFNCLHLQQRDRGENFKGNEYISNCKKAASQWQPTLHTSFRRSQRTERGGSGLCEKHNFSGKLCLKKMSEIEVSVRSGSVRYVRNNAPAFNFQKQ